MKHLTSLLFAALIASSSTATADVEFSPLPLLAGTAVTSSTNVSVPNFVGTGTNTWFNDTALQKYGIRTQVIKGPKFDRHIRRTNCETDIYNAIVFKQYPAAGTTVERGTVVSLSTKEQHEFIFEERPGVMCE